MTQQPTTTMTSSNDSKKAHQSNDDFKVIHKSKTDQTGSKNPPSSKPHHEKEVTSALRPQPPPLPPASTTTTTSDGGGAMAEVSGRDRLKRHRVEVAGRVWIPDIWGQEELLKDWVDCTTFDASLGNRNITLARAALVEEGRIRASSSGLRIENRC
ncbi:Protein BIC1 [Camellia lanceoleosa]|uniref:Protein BIC1 n=1 Tax=Camellia lanceoleosa TaxID=1840588 RepID=A0ACC0HMD5_9ERIC|nr:Protein BIC1 [Camellia lanceoleosa]